MFSLLQPTLFGSGKTRLFTDRNGRRDQTTDSFAEVTLMGAAFNESLLGLIWPALGVEFAAKTEILQGLRYHAHDCGPRLHFEYLFEADWSKNFAGKRSGYRQRENPNFSILLECVAERFQGQRFVYLTNKDTERQVNAQLVPIMGEQLPNAPWGLNCYQHVHNAAILSALNPTPAHLKFLESLGLSDFAIRNALFHSQIYQAIMRTSLRDLNSTAPVRIILPDLKSAMAVSQKFPGCQISRVTGEIDEYQPKPRGRPKKVQAQSELLLAA